MKNDARPKMTIDQFNRLAEELDTLVLPAIRSWSNSLHELFPDLSEEFIFFAIGCKLDIVFKKLKENCDHLKPVLYQNDELQ